MTPNDRDTLLTQIADDVGALVEARVHTEPYRKFWPPGTRKVKWFGHVTEQPSLLDQLRAGGPAAAGEGGSRGYESKVLVGECFDRLLAIEAGSAWWVTVVFSRPLRETAEGNLRTIVGHGRDLYLDMDVAELARDVRRWHGWASTLTGWTTPPFRPRASCPACSARRGTLRVRPDERTAACLQCGATWDQATFGILVDHIHAEGERDTPSESGVDVDVC